MSEEVDSRFLFFMKSFVKNSFFGFSALIIPVLVTFFLSDRPVLIKSWIAFTWLLLGSLFVGAFVALVLTYKKYSFLRKQKSYLDKSPMKEFYAIGFKQDRYDLVGRYRGYLVNVGWIGYLTSTQSPAYSFKCYYRRTEDCGRLQKKGVLGLMDIERLNYWYHSVRYDLGYSMFRPSFSSLKNRLDSIIDNLEASGIEPSNPEEIDYLSDIDVGVLEGAMWKGA